MPQGRAQLTALQLSLGWVPGDQGRGGAQGSEQSQLAAGAIRIKFKRRADSLSGGRSNFDQQASFKVGALGLA